jgi:Tfp pilus assembly protein PilV
MKSFFRTGGFTIIELLIAILISFIVISGFSYFVIQLNDEIQSASNTSEMYTSLTSFIQKMNNISKDYASYQIIQSSNTDTYGNVLFTNTGATTGTLL